MHEVNDSEQLCCGTSSRKVDICAQEISPKLFALACRVFKGNMMLLVPKDLPRITVRSSYDDIATSDAPILPYRFPSICQL